MSGANLHPQINIRVPIELKNKLHNTAKEHNISVNAEIVSRLSKSFQTSVNSDPISAEQVKALAKSAQEQLADTIYKITFETINKQVRLGHIRFHVNLTEFELEALEEDAFTSVFEPTFVKLEELGYVIDKDLWDCDGFSFEVG